MRYWLFCFLSFSLLTIITASIVFLFNIFLHIFHWALSLVSTDFLLDYFNNLWKAKLPQICIKSSYIAFTGAWIFWGCWGGFEFHSCYTKGDLSSSCHKKYQQCLLVSILDLRTVKNHFFPMYIKKLSDLSGKWQSKG